MAAVVAAGERPNWTRFIQHCMYSAPLVQHDLPALIEQHNPDRLVVDQLLFSAIAYAEATPGVKVRSYVVLHTTPLAVFPADGSGFAAIALQPVNTARARLQLAPLSTPKDMLAWCADNNGSDRHHERTTPRPTHCWSTRSTPSDSAAKRTRRLARTGRQERAGRRSATAARSSSCRSTPLPCSTSAREWHARCERWLSLRRTACWHQQAQSTCAASLYHPTRSSRPSCRTSTSCSV